MAVEVNVIFRVSMCRPSCVSYFLDVMCRFEALGNTFLVHLRIYYVTSV